MINNRISPYNHSTNHLNPHDKGMINRMKTKQQKREEALARQAEYDSLSLNEKLTKVFSRPGKSEKEHKRLVAKQEQLNKENASV